MKKIFILICLTLFYFSNSLAVTLYEALNQTYQSLKRYGLKTLTISTVIGWLKITSRVEVTRILKLTFIS